MAALEKSQVIFRKGNESADGGADIPEESSRHLDEFFTMSSGLFKDCTFGASIFVKTMSAV